jgi:hypothetical protein
MKKDWGRSGGKIILEHRKYGKSLRQRKISNLPGNSILSLAGAYIKREKEAQDGSGEVTRAVCVCVWYVWSLDRHSD